MSSDIPHGRYNERDIPFSRVRLKPGSPEYRVYYALRPEKKIVDDEIRALHRLSLFPPRQRFTQCLALVDSPKTKTHGVS